MQVASENILIREVHLTLAAAYHVTFIDQDQPECHPAFFGVNASC